jgi:hypothetical protein
MHKAYDIYLSAEVTADLAAKAGADLYRYECACCGEEVYLAAAKNVIDDFQYQRKPTEPHFRHYKGNNDVDCEQYLGQYGAISTEANSRKSKNERAEFYFDHNTKLFYIGLTFSERELSYYEEHAAIFELRTSSQLEPFYVKEISSLRFAPDIQELIPLNKFSNNYFLSNTLNGVKRKYDVFNNRKNSPTFFKLLAGDKNSRTKLVRSAILYTNTSYLMVFHGKRQSLDLVNYSQLNEFRIENSFDFETMGRQFIGRVITIDSKTVQNEHIVNSWGYQLESSERMTLLWPPAFISDDIFSINANAAYLYTTFEIQPHGNINVRSENISKICDGLTKVTVDSRVKVHKKNAEIMIENHVQESKCNTKLSIEVQSSKEYKALDESSFLFNRSGVSKLKKGSITHLTTNSLVKHYYDSYLDNVVKSPEIPLISKEQLIHDVLIYYKREDMFNWDEFESCDLSQFAFTYIEDCEKKGFINSAIKLLIKKGLL